jgi:hypothetical protein
MWYSSPVFPPVHGLHPDIGFSAVEIQQSKPLPESGTVEEDF